MVEISEIERKIEGIRPNRKIIVIGTVIITLSLLVMILLITRPSSTGKFNYIDILISNSTGMPSIVYYKNHPLFILSGWESKLEYSNISDRLVGNEEFKKIVFDDNGKGYTVVYSENEMILEPLTTNPQKATRIGWFTKPEQQQVLEKTSSGQKKVDVKLLNSDSDINKAEISYTFYDKKPYFKAEFSANANDPNLLGNFGYGFILTGYDIFLLNGTVLENDNAVIDLNRPVEIVLNQGQGKKTTTNISDTLKDSVLKTFDVSKSVVRKGSEYTINSEYQIFYNKKQKDAIIIYSPKTLYFEDSFYWNIYRLYVPHSNDGYSPVYFITLETPGLKYKYGSWQISTNDYSGDIKSYIDQTVKEIEAKNES